MLGRELHLREEIKSKDAHEIAVSSICAINRELEKYLSFYLNLLSISSEEYPLPDHLEGQELKNAFRDAIAAISIIKSKRQPLVLILEDWQWVDQASESALKHLVSITGTHPLMIVTVYRPNYSSKWSNWSYHTPIVLKSLDSLHSKNIVKSVFGIEHLPEELVELIITRTGGNPLFIEEVCHSLIESGVIEVLEGKQAILTQELETINLKKGVQVMPRYVIERTLPKLSSEELQDIGKKVVEVAAQMPGVTWIKSSISESEGKSYCEFEAPNSESLREHSNQVGLPVNKITAIEVEVDPSMFR